MFENVFIFLDDKSVMERTLSVRIPEKLLLEMKKHKVNWDDIIVKAIEEKLKRLSMDPQPSP